MSRAHDLFFQVSIPRAGDSEAFQRLVEAAEEWRNARNWLSVAIAMTRAEMAAWGDGDRLSNCLRAVMADYERCIRELPARSHEGLLGMWKLSELLSRFDLYFESSDKLAVLRSVRSLREELAQRYIAMRS